MESEGVNSSQAIPLDPAGWHARFVQQARWTKELRHYLFGRAGLDSARRVLDVGCGTGVLGSELLTLTAATVWGLDLDEAHLAFATRNAPGVSYTQGDAHWLPYSRGAFDLVLCHFLLLWVTDPLQVVSEMKRVTRPSGVVVALAEPDYGGRIDYPTPLDRLGAWQQESLRRQGADPLVGRRLAGIFHQAGLVEVETGVLGGQWRKPPSSAELDLEWIVLEDDLKQLADTGEIAGIQRLRSLDRQAWQNGERILFVPTFYALGHTPGKN